MCVYSKFSISCRYLSFALPFSASKREARNTSSGSLAPDSKVSILKFPSLFLSAHHAQLAINSRNSAIAGNRVGIAQSTHTGGKESKKSEPTQNSTTTTADTYGLSDEDDSVERKSIMQSPPKGMKRLESGVSLYHISLCYYSPDPSCRLLSRSRLAQARIRRVALRNTLSIPKSCLVGWDLLNQTSSTSTFVTWLHGRQQDLLLLVRRTFGIGDLVIRTPLSSRKAQHMFNW